MVELDPAAALALALAIAKAEAARKLARIQIRLLRKQVELSEKYRNIFAEQRAFYRDNFRARIEASIRQYATHAQFTPDYVASYGTAYGFMRGLAFKSRLIVFGSSNDTDILYNSYYGRKMRMYSVGRPADPFLEYYIYGQLDLSKIDAADHLFRYEQYKENIYNARRFDRMTSVAEYSNKHVVTAARDGASSFGAVASALTAKGNFYGARANDLMYGAGNLLQNTLGGLKNGTAPQSDPLLYSKRMENSTLSLTYNLPDGREFRK